MNTESWDGEVYTGNYEQEIKECFIEYNREINIPTKDLKNRSTGIKILGDNGLSSTLETDQIEQEDKH
jgi:hypothetical protein